MTEICQIETEIRKSSYNLKSIRVKHIPWKRCFDLLFSSFILLISFPFMLAIVTLIKCTSKGPILYYHDRIGRGGKLFRCYKFRTMRVDADKRLKQLLKTDPQLKAEWDAKYKLKNDPRITIIGRILRQTFLDELPQFFNVLKGDLSVVGPRPVVEQELERHFGVKAQKILSIRPGITGLWQLSERNKMTYNTRIELDEEYVDTHSLKLDLKLIAKTIPAIITAKGDY